MLCVDYKFTLNMVLYNYIIKYFKYQAYASKIFARMFLVQLRYFQYILSFAIFAGVLLSSKALITACFVGLTLIWLTEMLIGQFDISSEKYFIILNILLLSFSPIAVKSMISSINTIQLFLLVMLVALIYFLFQQELNIFKIGNILFVLAFSFFVNSYVIDELFQNNILYVSYMFLLLLFLKTLATYFNVQFSNFQFFFNFFVVVVVFSGISSFYDYQFLDVLLGALTIALTTTFLNFIIIKVRFEYELTSKLSSQIYIFDFLFAFMASLYFVDALNVVNGLF